MPEMPATLASCGQRRGGQHLRSAGVASLGRGCMARAARLCAVLIAAQHSRSGAGHQQKQRRNGRSLQAGKVVQDALAQTLIPAPGRQRVERFVEPQASAGDQIRIRLHDGMRIGQHLERQHLLALLLALGAASHMPLELVDLLVGQLPISRSDDPFVCKFAIHGYVLLASKAAIGS